MRFSIFVCVAVVAALAIAPIGAVAVVQDATNATANTTEVSNTTNTTNATNDTLEADREPIYPDPPEPEPEDNITVANMDPEQYEEKVDSTLAITDWAYADRTFTLTFHADESQEITVAEAIRADEGTGRVTWDTYDVEEGNQTIEVPVRTAPRGMYRGAAITIASDKSREAGHASYVSSGQIEPDRGPISYHSVQVMVLVAGIGGAALTLRIVRKRRNDETKDWERIA